MSATQQETANPLETASYDDVLTVIRHWSPRLRTSLIRDVADMQLDTEEPHRKDDIWARVMARPDTGLPVPTDEEVEQWMDEHRMEKYG